MWRFLLFLLVLGAVTFTVLYYGGAFPFSPQEIQAKGGTNHALPTGQRPSTIDKPLASGRGQARRPVRTNESDGRRGWDNVVVANAVVAPIEEREIASRLEEVGYVAEMLVDENQWVRRGQVLLRMDDSVLRAAEETALLKATDEISIQAAQEKYNATYEMYQKDLIAGSSVSAQDKLVHRYQKDAAWSELKKAELEKKVAGLELKRLREQLKLYEIVTDIDGVVTRVLKRKGESAQRGEVVVKVANYERLKIEGQARAEQARLLRPGMRVLVEPENPLTCAVLRGHRDAVTSLVVTPDNRLLASGSKDGTIILWNWAVRQPIKVLRDLEAPFEVQSLATCDPVVDEASRTTTYRFLAGGAEGRARLWTVVVGPSGQVEAKFTDLADQHRGIVRSVALSADGQFAATGGADNQIAIWQIDGGEATFLYKVRERLDERDTAHRGVVTTLTFNPDGTLISAATDKTIRKWQLGETYAVLLTNETGRSGDVATLGVSRDGNRVLFDFGEELRIYDLTTGTIAGTLHGEGQGAFASLALFSPDEDMILTFTSNGRLQLWMAPAPTFFRQAAAEGFRRNTPFALGALGSVLVPQGDLLSVGWAATAAEQKTTLAKPREGLVGTGSVTVPGQTAIPQLWPLNGYEIRHLVTPETSAVRCGAFDATGSVLFTGGDDRQVRIWSLPTPDERHDPLEAVITAVGEQIESGTNLVRIKAEMDNPRDPARRLLPGIRVNLSLFPQDAR